MFGITMVSQGLELDGVSNARQLGGYICRGFEISFWSDSFRPVLLMGN